MDYANLNFKLDNMRQEIRNTEEMVRYLLFDLVVYCVLHIFRLTVKELVTTYSSCMYVS